jgi:hypothetical protein
MPSDPLGPFLEWFLKQGFMPVTQRESLGLGGSPFTPPTTYEFGMKGPQAFGVSLGEWQKQLTQAMQALRAHNQLPPGAQEMLHRAYQEGRDVSSYPQAQGWTRWPADLMKEFGSQNVLQVAPLPGPFMQWLWQQAQGAPRT